VHEEVKGNVSKKTPETSQFLNAANSTSKISTVETWHGHASGVSTFFFAYGKIQRRQARLRIARHG